MSKNEWPFNTKYKAKAKRSITSYIKSIIDDNFEKSVSRREDRTARAHLATGGIVSTLIRFEEPFDAIEIDAYRIDSICCVEIENPAGGKSLLEIDRLWLLATIDKISSFVLAYLIEYRPQVGASDVVKLIRDAVLLDYTDKINSIEDIQLPPGFPRSSKIVSSFSGTSWSAIYLDNALSNLAKTVHQEVRKKLGCTFNWGSPGRFERRPSIERLFRTISSEIFHRLPSTTGSNPYKGRADDAGKKAIKLRILSLHIEHLTQNFIFQHNQTESKGLGYNSPIEYLTQFTTEFNDHFIARKILHI